jgi:hypothetical protein
VGFKLILEPPYLRVAQRDSFTEQDEWKIIRTTRIILDEEVHSPQKPNLAQFMRKSCATNLNSSRLYGPRPLGISERDPRRHPWMPHLTHNIRFHKDLTLTPCHPLYCEQERERHEHW